MTIGNNKINIKYWLHFWYLQKSLHLHLCVPLPLVWIVLDIWIPFQICPGRIIYRDQKKKKSDENVRSKFYRLRLCPFNLVYCIIIRLGSSFFLVMSNLYNQRQFFLLLKHLWSENLFSSSFLLPIWLNKGNRFSNWFFYFKILQIKHITKSFSLPNMRCTKFSFIKI